MVANQKIVVTGGGGFVGSGLCRRLRQDGFEVVSIARQHYEKLEALGVSQIAADIGGPVENFMAALEGAFAVFHVAANTKMWGKEADFMRTNFTATENLLEACRRQGLKRFVYTSSPSVVADGTDLCGIDESYPYPERYEAFYPKTKALAEQLVLATTDPWTVALRPHLIWGPGDTNLTRVVVERARSGALVQIGKGENLVDTSYIDDCVTAHMLALRALDSNPACRGKVYFISQGEPVKLWWWINELLVRYGVAPVKKQVSAGVAGMLAWVLEFVARVDPRGKEPRLSKFLVHEMATSHYFSIKNAERDLGYRPTVSVAEGLRRVGESLDPGGAIVSESPSREVFAGYRTSR